MQLSILSEVRTVMPGSWDLKDVEPLSRMNARYIQIPIATTLCARTSSNCDPCLFLNRVLEPSIIKRLVVTIITRTYVLLRLIAKSPQPRSDSASPYLHHRMPVNTLKGGATVEWTTMQTKRPAPSSYPQWCRLIALLPASGLSAD